MSRGCEEACVAWTRVESRVCLETVRRGADIRTRRYWSRDRRAGRAPCTRIADAVHAGRPKPSDEKRQSTDCGVATVFLDSRAARPRGPRPLDLPAPIAVPHAHTRVRGSKVLTSIVTHASFIHPGITHSRDSTTISVIRSILDNCTYSYTNRSLRATNVEIGYRQSRDLQHVVNIYTYCNVKRVPQVSAPLTTQCNAHISSHIKRNAKYKYER